MSLLLALSAFGCGDVESDLTDDEMVEETTTDENTESETPSEKDPAIDELRELVADLSERVDALERATGTTDQGEVAGVVGLGTIIAHMPHLPGALTVDQMRAAGFAEADGRTPEEQGISGAVITDATPDLNGDGLFLRGGPPSASGDVQGDATAINALRLAVSDPGHGHIQDSHRHSTHTVDSPGFCHGNSSAEWLGFGIDWQHNSRRGCGHFGGSARPSIHSSRTNVSVELQGGDDETRPANMTVVWMIRVR